MGIAKHPSRLSLPFIDKPYPAILEFLMQRFPKVGMAVWEERILNGKVLDDAGAPITLETPYVPQKRLFYYREVAEEPLIPLQEKILFQNDELLVACKPPFLPVTPSGPYVNECLLNRLRRKTGNSSLVPLHRIDRETSGLVLFSMNKETRGLYGGLFLSRTIEKTYEALSEVSFSTERKDWTVENRLVDDDIWFRSKVVPGVVNARSRIKRVSYRDNKAHFLLYPITGKKHQLRVHMSGLGFRIMHDRYYPELLDKQEDDLSNPLQLIARRVKFTDPVSGEIMEFESDRQLLL
ncbi:pseudouridine synthase [Deltaproteobacteria bacterium IMCC39524]|nr:pseudouridine synthase [Deltaproteobacteria bacterium IMCC39524]